jgi:hypothetical protein
LSNGRVLYIVVCAAPPARDVGVLIDRAKEQGYDVCLIATPAAHRWLDVPGLMERTGHPVRFQHRMLGEPDVIPAPDAIIVAPATFNTLNKWAGGITDNLALGLLCEGIGLGLPLVALPYMTAAQARHPALPMSVRVLRDAGISVLFGDDVFPLRGPRQGDASRFPWEATLDALERKSDAHDRT